MIQKVSTHLKQSSYSVVPNVGIGRSLRALWVPGSSFSRDAKASWGVLVCTSLPGTNLLRVKGHEGTTMTVGLPPSHNLSHFLLL